MRDQKFTLSVAALLILFTCGAVLAQDAARPLPSADAAASAKNSSQQIRGSYKPAGATAAGQKGVGVEAVGDTESSTPYRTFTSGSGDTGFRYSVSVTGNVVSIESPIYSGAPYQHIFGQEGYAVSMNTSIGRVTYWDAGISAASGCSGTSRSWSSTVFETGVNSGGTTLTRSTCDGAWELTQTFLRNAINHELTITMTLKNTSGFNYTGVELARYFDGDIDGDGGDDFYNKTLDSVYGQDTGIDNLMLTALSFNIAHTTAVHTYNSWNRSVTTQASVATPTSPGDYVGRATYLLGTINNGTQKIVKVMYKRS